MATEQRAPGLPTCHDCGRASASEYAFSMGGERKAAHLCINCVRARVSRTLVADALERTEDAP